MSAISRLMGVIFKFPAAETHQIAIEKGIMIPMRDGVNLVADRYYPRKGSDLPVILLRSSYGRAHLKNRGEGLRPSPVRLYVMGLKQWRDFPEWPPAGYRARNWYLHPGKKLAAAKPAASNPDAYTYDPADPTPLVGGAIMSKGGAGDNRKLEARKDVLTFTSEVLEKDTEVIGAVSAELYIRSSRQYMDFFVRLCDVHPSGKSVNICDGIQRLRPGRPAPEADGCTKVKVDLWPTACLFRRGHRIRLQVSGGAFPRFARNPGGGEPLATATELWKAEQEIYHDPAHPSAVVLPVGES